MPTRELTTIICSKKPHSSLPQDWVLGFEGEASTSEVERKAKGLLKRFLNVKVFVSGKCVSRYEARRPSWSSRELSRPSVPEPLEVLQPANQGGENRSGAGVPLRTGDRIKVGGHIYLVRTVSSAEAFAVPQGHGRHLRTLTIAPPFTTRTIRFVSDVPKPSTAATGRKIVYRPSKRRKPLQRPIVAVSASGCATVNYKDTRLTIYKVSGGLPDSNRRRH